MAYPSREAVYSALFARLNNIPGFNTYTRLVELPADQTKQRCPRLILLEGDTVDRYDGNRLDKSEWYAAVVIYFFKPSVDTPGATILNPLIDSVRDALKPDNLQQNVLVLRDPTTGVQLASWVRIEGTTVVENGDTDPTLLGYVGIPIRMLVP